MLKSDKITKQYVLDLVERSCKVMNIPFPKVVFDRHEYKIYFNQKKKVRKNLSELSFYGKAIKLNYAIFINIEAHSTIRELNDTVVHECTHLKNFELKHGKTFDNLVRFYLNCLFDYGINKDKVYK